ncbi:hypothetical protein [Actinoplanes couchii]|uniref:Uncharacterized protein n=1 Tax=Actinoplanes couchii TaxID=403638 RepID=A0ABQ3XTJ5_9ACTN|nr:hypothetical protein [Actinoplanes couchii]MDR6318935.1 hypothetical protein [Actinoplanes couchii]GID61843.1 hypothetical protein Aco03nite_102470 [Actinoplanes couchii]
MIDHDMACRACTRALIAVPLNGRVVYQHPVTPDGDHQPDPVPAHRLTAVYRRCHLCSAQPPLWEYRTDGIVADIQNYSTRWHVCPTCAHLIDTGDQPALTRRCCAAIGWPVDGIAAHILAGLHQAIVLSREPGRTLLTTADPQPATLRPPTLPRVRDRLTALLRGPVAIPAPLHDSTGRNLLADSLEQARLYWIDTEFTDLIQQAHTDLPATTFTGPLVPLGPGLLTWAHPVDHRHRLAAASWTPQPGGWLLVGYRSLGADIPADHHTELRRQIGWLIPVHVRHLPDGGTIDADDPLAALAATWLIINQELTAAEPTPAEPALRRSYSRARRPAPEIRILRIKPVVRRALSQPATAGTRASLRHRFWVRQHQRQQAYGPGRTLRRETPIPTYLKGPNGAPIKPSTTIRVLGTSR